MTRFFLRRPRSFMSDMMTIGGLKVLPLSDHCIITTTYRFNYWVTSFKIRTSFIVYLPSFIAEKESVSTDADALSVVLIYEWNGAQAVDKDILAAFSYKIVQKETHYTLKCWWPKTNSGKWIIHECVELPQQIISEDWSSKSQFFINIFF